MFFFGEDEAINMAQRYGPWCGRKGLTKEEWDRVSARCQPQTNPASRRKGKEVELTCGGIVKNRLLPEHTNMEEMHDLATLIAKEAGITSPAILTYDCQKGRPITPYGNLGTWMGQEEKMQLEVYDSSGPDLIMKFQTAASLKEYKGGLWILKAFSFRLTKAVTHVIHEREPEYICTNPITRNPMFESNDFVSFISFIFRFESCFVSF